MTATFGELIRDQRTRAGLSLRALARQSQISPTYLSHVETNRCSPPSPHVVTRLSLVLGIPSSLAMERAGYLNTDEVVTLSMSALEHIRKLASSTSRDPALALVYIKGTAERTIKLLNKDVKHGRRPS